MNLILVLIALPLVCGAIALYLAEKDHTENRRANATRYAVAKIKHSLLRNGRVLPFTAVLMFLPLGRPAHAQEVIHARAGQLVAADPTAKTLTLKVADGSTVVFHNVATPEPAMSFDKDIRDKTTAAAAFHDVGAYVIVFYFGFSDPTAVAVESMGTTPPTRTTGSVASFDRHQHLLTLKAENAGPQKVVVSEDTILDTPEGVERTSDFHPSKGQRLRCFKKPESQTALFVAMN